MTADEVSDFIDRASIVENMERTKIYWEQMMMAAQSEREASRKGRQWNPSEQRHRNSDADVRGIDKSNSDAESESEAESLAGKMPPRKSRSRHSFPLSMEGRIALELQEMKEREEELKEWRNKIAIENCKEKDSLNGNEELSSLHTTDDGNYSEYGSEEKDHSLDESNRFVPGSSRVDTPHSEDFAHLRTRSMDSVSSGHSSGSGSVHNDKDPETPKRRVVVRPYEDPDEANDFPCYTWEMKETPIEKEIRVAREREEELRREKGTAAVIANCKALREKIRSNGGGGAKSSEIVEHDPRGIQHRLATCRIQQEIEETNERERQLRTEGKILLTSEETLDSKVMRLPQLVEKSISKNKEQGRTRRCQMTSQRSEERVGERKARNPVAAAAARRRSNRGVMQQFYSMQGKAFTPPANLQTKSDDGVDGVPRSRPFVKKSNGEAVVHARKGYVPVAEKIQKELMDNRMREEELRLQRARMLSRSQPNLLDLDNYDEAEVAAEEEEEEEEEGGILWERQEDRPCAAPRLVHSLSNPNLADDALDKMHKLPKKFSLLEEWEKRIRESVRKD